MLSVVSLSAQSNDPSFGRNIQKDENGFITRMEVCRLIPPAESQYTELKNRQSALTAEINELKAELEDAGRCKTKRLNKKIAEKEESLAAVERTMNTYPRKMTDPNYKEEPKVDEAFRAQLNALIEKKKAEANGASAQIDMKEASVIASNLEEKTTNSYGFATSEDKVYRVLLAIENKQLPVSKLQGLGDVAYTTSNGQIIYYQGNYKTKEAAEQALETIIAQGRFLDAFVVSTKVK